MIKPYVVDPFQWKPTKKDYKYVPKKNIFYSKKHAPEEIIIIDKINFITFLLSLFFYKTKIIFFTKTNTTREKFLFAIFDFIKKNYKVDSINYDNNPSF